MRPQSAKRSSAITVIGCAVGLEVVNTNLAAPVKVPAWFCSRWLRMAGSALCLTAEQFIAAFSRIWVKTTLRWCRGGNRQLIKVQCWKFRGDQIHFIVHVSEVISCCDRILLRIVESYVEEISFAVHFEIGYKCIPVTHSAPVPSPRMQVDSSLA